jgi:hypothetical protein
MVQTRRLQVLISMRSLLSFKLLYPSSCTISMGLTQIQTEISTRSRPGGKGGLA